MVSHIGRCRDLFLRKVFAISLFLLLFGGSLSAQAAPRALNDTNQRGKTIKDPTAPLNSVSVVVSKKKKNIKLSAIYHKENKYLAVLNGRTVGVGDSIEGKVVRKIDANTVTFSGEGADSIVLFRKITINEQ